jgi:hypothetical protein
VVSAREPSIDGRFARISASAIARSLFAGRGVERGSSARRAHLRTAHAVTRASVGDRTPPTRVHSVVAERALDAFEASGEVVRARHVDHADRRRVKDQGDGVARGCRDTSRAAAAARQRGASSRSPPLRSRRATPSRRATRSRATFARAARRRRPRASRDAKSPSGEPTLAFHHPHRSNPLPLGDRRRAPTATPRTRSGHPCPTASSCASSVPASTADSASTSASSGARPNLAPRDRRVSFPEPRISIGRVLAMFRFRPACRPRPSPDRPNALTPPFVPPRADLWAWTPGPRSSSRRCRLAVTPT